MLKNVNEACETLEATKANIKKATLTATKEIQQINGVCKKKGILLVIYSYLPIGTNSCN